MDFNSIKFSKLFTDKHGGEVFNEVKDLIEKEKNEKCDNNYIEAIFKVAFMGYFGLDNDGLNNMLRISIAIWILRILQRFTKILLNLLEII